ncbi:D-alanyl-D-alanine carboxypeptidase [Oceanidesulfovibrio indonesiensis]|uniref:D-alanyl-D-alanine carboxypeptidase n=1 Tax=Oceanidesulfovibrio indonesiensis TaxID=54767 RepID=A0A7M3MF27_9BACT|nr:D-alanyl-D-alanine carboxypeptidase family protein [Oceanidesulfovibrio indonesiensis]TVM17619.1 D-alanyl-D-alanine carboxypeptidase [Oceanidesulfovibrio indonesiensis]
MARNTVGGFLRSRFVRLFAFFILALSVSAWPRILHCQSNFDGPSQLVAAALLMDVQSGEFLHGVAADTHIPPASLTKIMTLFLVFDALSAGKVRQNDVMRVDDSVQDIYGARLGLQPGDVLTVGEAIYGVAVASANDAATALAVHIAGSEQAFVTRMNEKAASLELRNTYYENPHGLPSPGQKTTAADVANISRAYILSHTEALEVHSARTFQFRDVVFSNRNTLLGAYPGLDGLKTGFIRASGHCLVATATRHGRRLLSVVLGAASPEERDAASVELLDYGFTASGPAAFD